MHKVRHFVLWQIKLNQQGQKPLKRWFWQKKQTFAEVLSEDPTGEPLLHRLNLNDFYRQKIQPYQGTSLVRKIKRTWHRITGNFSEQNQLYHYALNRKTLVEKIQGLSLDQKKEFETFTDYIQSVQEDTRRGGSMFSAIEIKQAMLKAQQERETAQQVPVSSGTAQEKRIQKAAVKTMKQWRSDYQDHIEEITKQYRPDLFTIRLGEPLQKSSKNRRKEGLEEKIEEGQKNYKSSTDKEHYATECNREFESYEQGFLSQVKAFMMRLLPNSVKKREQEGGGEPKEEIHAALLPMENESSTTSIVISTDPIVQPSSSFFLSAMKQPAILNEEQFNKLTESTRGQLTHSSLEAEAIKPLLETYRRQTESYMSFLAKEAYDIMQEAQKERGNIKGNINNAMPLFQAKLKEIERVFRHARLVLHPDKYVANKEGDTTKSILNEQFHLLTQAIVDLKNELKLRKTDEWHCTELNQVLERIIQDFQILEQSREELREGLKRQNEETKQLKEQVQQLEAHRKEGTKLLKEQLQQQEQEMQAMWRIILANEQGTTTLSTAIDATTPVTPFWQPPLAKAVKESKTEDAQLETYSNEEFFS